MATILLIVLVLLLIGALPSWPYSTFHGVAGLTFHASRPWHLASCPPFHGDPARRGACQTWPGHITDGPPDGPDFPSTSNGTTTTPKGIAAYSNRHIAIGDSVRYHSRYMWATRGALEDDHDRLRPLSTSRHHHGLGAHRHVARG